MLFINTMNFVADRLNSWKKVKTIDLVKVEDAEDVVVTMFADGHDKIVSKALHPFEVVFRVIDAVNGSDYAKHDIWGFPLSEYRLDDSLVDFVYPRQVMKDVTVASCVDLLVREQSQVEIKSGQDDKEPEDKKETETRKSSYVITPTEFHDAQYVIKASVRSEFKLNQAKSLAELRKEVNLRDIEARIAVKGSAHLADEVYVPIPITDFPFYRDSWWNIAESEMVQRFIEYKLYDKLNS